MHNAKSTVFRVICTAMYEDRAWCQQNAVISSLEAVMPEQGQCQQLSIAQRKIWNQVAVQLQVTD